MTDRDLITHSRVIQNAKTLAVTILMHSKPSYIPRVKGLIRVPKSIGFWFFKPVKNGRVMVIYQLHSEPGGSIPSWLSNSAVVDMPYNTLRNLRREVVRYRNARYPMIKEK